ncbi:phage recombination protein Bet [Oligella urethralis]|uniref:phage recombination protein Bet n=1 Tax=Oligella urethralis TaxID=90245 RepID=UPI00242CBE99|nr:phage recombination protein Bet [Oligella urethralis]
MSAITVKDDGSLDISRYAMSALRNSVFPGASDESIYMAAQYCAARKLDIFKKPIHIVPLSVRDSITGKYETRDVIMPGIYELRTTAFRTGEMAGIDEPIFGEEKKIKGVDAPEWCKVTVYRVVNGVRYAFSHVEYFEEAAATKNNGELNSMWTKRPRGQLAKCAEAGALRKAFPDEMGGIMTSDEISEMDNMPEIDITPQYAESGEIQEIKRLMNETSSDEAKFLNFFGISSYQEITPEISKRAIDMLKSKVEKVVEPKIETADIEEAEFEEIDI